MMLKGKTALVTGSTSGIGRAIAEAFAEQGAAVVLNGFGEAGEIDRLRADIERRSGATASYLAADLAKPQEIEGMFEAARKRHGSIDILVNNAGIQHVAPLESFPTERWDAILAVNLTASFHTTRLVLSGMRAKGWGRVINIASVQGLIGSIHKSAYVAAKHGIVGLTKVTALEAAGSGVTCNAICPGWVLTPLVQRQVDARAAEKGLSQEAAKTDLLAERTPTREFVTPQQLAALAVFLASPAADNLTGAAIPVDGGWVAQ